MGYMTNVTRVACDFFYVMVYIVGNTTQRSPRTRYPAKPIHQKFERSICRRWLPDDEIYVLV